MFSFFILYAYRSHLLPPPVLGCQLKYFDPPTPIHFSHERNIPNRCLCLFILLRFLSVIPLRPTGMPRPGVARCGADVFSLLRPRLTIIASDPSAFGKECRKKKATFLPPFLSRRCWEIMTESVYFFSSLHSPLFYYVIEPTRLRQQLFVLGTDPELLMDGHCCLDRQASLAWHSVWLFLFCVFIFPAKVSALSNTAVAFQSPLT